MNDTSQIYCQNCRTLLNKGSSFCPFCGSTNKVIAKQKPEVSTPDEKWLETYDKIKQGETDHHQDKDYNAPYTYLNQVNTFKSINAYTDPSNTPSYIGCSSVFEFIMLFFDILFTGCGCLPIMMIGIFVASFMFLVL